MKPELWKPIIGYETDYEVSNHGRVRRISSGSNNAQPGRILGTYNGHGYLNTTLCSQGQVRRFRTHVLVARAFVLNPESKPQVNHKDGNKANNYYENLEWATPSENQRHAVAAGLHMKLPGESNPQSKLTTAQVLQIREWRAKGCSLATLAAEYGVGIMQISRICSRKRWAHI